MKAVIKEIKRSDKSALEKERESAVHDLYLLKESLFDHNDEGMLIPEVPEGIPDTKKENDPPICIPYASNELQEY